MLRILFDVGNTNIKMGLARSGRLEAVYSLPSDVRTSPDLLGVQLLRFWEHSGAGGAALAGALACSVVPGLNALLAEACGRYLKTGLAFAPEDVPIPLQNRYSRPAEVGADRLVGAFAARRLLPDPPSLISVDFGTATTFDVVDVDGAYLGGVIAPGINLSIDALHRAAARLPRIGIGRPQAVIGRATVPAMQSGIYWGYVGLIEGIISRIKAEYGAPLKVVATGGLAPLFAEGTLVIERTDPDITLEGLRLLADRNPVPVFHHSALRDPLRSDSD